MAPKRKRTTDAVSPSAAAGRVTRSSARATRSATRLNKASLHSVSDNPEPRKKNTPTPTKNKKAKTEASESGVAKKTKTEEAEDASGCGAPKKTVVIEHCKQCSCFKKSAAVVKEGLEEKLSGGVNVVVNPEKPRRGCFEIREEGGEVLLSLTDLKRPFKKLKELDMDQVVADIVDKIH